MVNQSQFIEMFGDTFQNERGWPYKKLPEVSTIVLGSTPSSSNAAFWDGDVKWITPAELSNDSFYVYDSERHITEEGVRSTSLKPFPAGTVILSTRAPIGKTAIAGCEMYCNQGFKNFICDNTINPVYLFYTLRIHNPELQKMGTGSTFLELSKKVIEQISISVPPKVLQDRFEQFYNHADKSKFAGFKSQFIEKTSSSSSPSISLKEVVSIVRKNVNPTSGKTYTLYSFQAYDNRQMPEIVDGGEIRSCKLDLTPNTVLYNKLNVRLCRVWSIREIATTNSICSTEFIPLKMDENVLLQEYLVYFLTSEAVTKAMVGVSQGTSNSQKRIAPEALLKLEIPLPPIEVQKEFVAVYKESDKSKYLN